MVLIGPVLCPKEYNLEIRSLCLNYAVYASTVTFVELMSGNAFSDRKV